MKKLIILLAVIGLIFISRDAWCQTKQLKQHVFYDTVKTVKERVDFSPDTIPVFFKELIVGETVKENWIAGYVVWQTYKRSQDWSGSSIRLGTGIYSSLNQQPSYYKDEFEPTITDTRTCLYADRKTKVTNKIIMIIKR